MMNSPPPGMSAFDFASSNRSLASADRPVVSAAWSSSPYDSTQGLMALFRPGADRHACGKRQMPSGGVG